MATFASRLRDLRKGNKLSQEDLAKVIGLSKSAISMYERGVREPDYEILTALCDYFNVDENYMLGRQDTITILPQSVHAPSLVPIRIPVLGSIPAGVPIEAIEDILDWEELDPREYSPAHEYFALCVKGNSMYPDYWEGDTIICQKADDAESGSDVVAYVNGYEATLKQLIKRSDGAIELRPRNPAHPPQVYRDEPVTILGFVKEQRRKKG